MINKGYRFFLILQAFILFVYLNAKSEEGIWLPYFLDEEILTDMQAKGCRLSAEEIFSINESALNNAIVSFSGFCTASFISSEGLLLTNHHCGYDYIQNHSTTENNLLENGFWAKNREEELPNPGAYIRILKKVEDVTDIVMSDISDSMDFGSRMLIIAEITDSLEMVISDSVNMKVSVERFYAGNAYYMFYYEEYNDIRLVGAPPSSIGKFGGETDNWMWPRHNADFSLFRVYTDSSGSSSEYADNNIPYKPSKHFKLSLKEIAEGDFTMVFGYPGRTYEYLTSAEIEYEYSVRLPSLWSILDTKLRFLEQEMKNNELINLQYAAKYSGTSNTWKKLNGVMFGMKTLDLVNLKRTNDSLFIASVKEEEIRKQIQDVYSGIAEVYKKYQHYMFIEDAIILAMFNTDFAEFLNDILSEIRQLNFNSNDLYSSLKKTGHAYYREFNQRIDLGLTTALFTRYMELASPDYYPDELKDISPDDTKAINKTFKKMYNRSLFKDEEEYLKTIKEYTENGINKMQKDPLMEFYFSCIDIYFDLNDLLAKAENELDSLHNKYMSALMHYNQTKKIYPDANSTFRMSYGEIKNYQPKDAVRYKHYTTLGGVLEKSYSDNPEYKIPPDLYTLYEQKEYKPYSLSPVMPVCFIATNHTSGGNSGSPVLDGYGNLIGINFDRNWEGTIGDYYYNEKFVRNISVSIGYILFIIDKYANAGYLIEEMDILN